MGPCRMPIRTLIVDDEPPGRQRLRALLEADPDVTVVGECADGIEALAALRSQPCDLVFLRVDAPKVLAKIKTVKSWIEKSGAIWVVRRKGRGAPISDTDLIAAALDAGLVDNKIASFSDTEGAMRLVFRLRDR